LAQFALISGSGVLDTYACALSKFALTENSTSLLDYLNKLGKPQPPLPWKGMVAEIPTQVADIIAMSYRGEVAETCLFVYTLHGATVAIRDSNAPSFSAQPLALLRSSIEVQKQLIVALYEEE
jgi:hypothetical protein